MDYKGEEKIIRSENSGESFWGGGGGGCLALQNVGPIRPIQSPVL